MTSLLELRKKIDQIDQQLLSLFEQRMALSLEVAKNKKSNATPVANPAREAEILETVSDTLSPQIEGYGRILYHTIFDVSRSYQNLYLSRISDLGERIQVALTDTPKIFPKKAMVACQGIEGSYSEAACKKLFAQPKTLFFNQFKHVFEAVDKGMCQYGILPLENSSYGSVGPVYDLMRNYNFHIVRSVRLRVSHQLLDRPG
ncbi:MAG: prephenate dehydratase domain-containing protein, partial [Anaerovoracaceae bacterium]